jgi:hypothetical protein
MEKIILNVNQSIQTTLDLFYMTDNDFIEEKDELINEYNDAIELYINELSICDEKTDFYKHLKDKIENIIIKRNNYIIQKKIINNNNKFKYQNINIIYSKNKETIDEVKKKKKKKENIELLYEFDEKKNVLNVKNIFIIKKSSNIKKKINSEIKIKQILEFKINEIESHLHKLININDLIKILSEMLEILTVPDVIEFFKEQIENFKEERNDYLISNNISII